MSGAKSSISKLFGSRKLDGISEIRTFFRTNEQPIFFIGPTAFNLLGIDRWVRGFEYVVYYDSWDSGHGRVFTPVSKPFVEFESSEQINNYLLRDPEVRRPPAPADPDRVGRADRDHRGPASERGQPVQGREPARHRPDHALPQAARPRHRRRRPALLVRPD